MSSTMSYVYVKLVVIRFIFSKDRQMLAFTFKIPPTYVWCGDGINNLSSGLYPKMLLLSGSRKVFMEFEGMNFWDYETGEGYTLEMWNGNGVHDFGNICFD